jgi:hypothetical protein
MAEIEHGEVIVLQQRVAKLERERDAAQEKNANLLALLRRVEWVAELQDYLWEDCCPDCRRRKEEGHAPDCELAKALKGGE